MSSKITSHLDLNHSFIMSRKKVYKFPKVNNILVDITYIKGTDARDIFYSGVQGSDPKRIYYGL